MKSTFEFSGFISIISQFLICKSKRGSAKKFFLGSSFSLVLCKRIIFLIFLISVIRIILSVKFKNGIERNFPEILLFVMLMSTPSVAKVTMPFGGLISDSDNK